MALLVLDNMAVEHLDCLGKIDAVLLNVGQPLRLARTPSIDFGKR
jgi:hypothetical protein